MVKELVKEIRSNLSQTSSSQKDEVRVMRALLNDTDYSVEVYSRDGETEEYFPSKDMRGMCANIISSTTKMSNDESSKLMEGYEFKKSDATTMIGVSKEFVHSVIQTGRKLPLGAREKSNVSISLKEVKATTRTYPKKVGVGEDGKGVYENTPTEIKAHESVRVHSQCPEWVK